jgi:TPR repeat protein
MDSSIELLGNSMNHSHIILTCLLFISSAAIAEDKPAPSLSQYDDGGASTPYSRMPHEVDKSPTNLYRNDYARTMDARIAREDAQAAQSQLAQQKVQIELRSIQQSQAAEAAVTEFYQGASTRPTDALRRFITNRPEITLSPKYAAVQEYIRTREGYEQPAKTATVFASGPAAMTPAAPTTAGKELTPEQMMKLAEMKIASPAAYNEAVKMFAQAGYNLKTHAGSESPSTTKNPPTPSGPGTIKLGELSYEELLALSKNGNAEAQFALACRFYTGDEVKKDLKTAYDWLIQSANRGNTDAMYALGVHNQRGEGVAKNFVESYAWFYVANQAGYALAAEAIREYGATLTLAEKSQATQRGNELLQQIKTGQPKPILVQKSADLITEKMKQIIFPTCQFTGATVAEAIEYLRVMSREYDTIGDNTGVNVMLFSKDVTNASLTLDLKNVPMYEALKIITELAKMRFLVDDQGVVVVGLSSNAQVSNLGEIRHNEALLRFSETHSLAEKGDLDAQCNLAVMYCNGEGTETNLSEAIKWFRKSADQGSARGQCNLAVMYKNGEGTEKNISEAVKWYQKAANQGYARGQYSLGLRYSKGEGVAQNHSEAVKLYRMAAMQGYVFAQYALALRISKGEGAPKDDVEACAWYYLASQGRYAKAQEKIKSFSPDVYQKGVQRGNELVQQMKK